MVNFTIDNGVLKGYSGDEREITIPDGVYRIGEYSWDAVFRDHKELINILLPEGLLQIGENTFKGCSELVNITLPDSVKEIGNYAFEGCSGLSEIIIPDSVEKIGYGAFENCSGLTNISIPAGITSIEWSAFEGCSRLACVTIPDSLIKIGDSAFNGCSGLTKINIPESIRLIGSRAFNGCSGLLSMPLPDGLVEISRLAFAGCNGLTNVTIPKGLRKIEWGAFANCSGLINISLPDGIEEIEEHAFDGCSKLKKIVIPESVQKIGGYAFCDCCELESIVIPEGVKEIGAYAFQKCCNLVHINIPAGLSDIDSNIVKIIDGCTRISGINDEFFTISSYLVKYNGNKENVIIPNEIKVICDKAFSGHKEISNITLPAELKGIGSSVFQGCSGLTSVVIPEGVEEINYCSFEDCSGLTNVIIPSGLTHICGGAFINCTCLTGIVIPDKVSQIGDGAFMNCKSLTEIIIPGGVVEIDISVFSGCEKLEKIVIENNKCKISWDPDYGSYCADEIQLTPQIIESIYPLVTDLVLTEFVLSPDMWPRLSSKAQTDIFLTRRNKAVKDLYHFAEPEKIGEIIAERLSGKPTSKNCDAAGYFISLYYTLIPKELTVKIYSGLKAAKTGAKAVSMLESDSKIMAFINEKSEETNLLTVEQKVMDILTDQSISYKAPEFNLNRYYGLNSDDLPVITDTEGNTVSAFVLSWLLTVHEGWEPRSKGGNCYEAYEKPGICPEAQEVVDLLNPESFQQALMKLTNASDQLFPVCRYADEKTMESLAQTASRWWVSVTSGKDAPAMRIFRRAAKYSTTRVALLFAEKYDDLSDYAEIRGMDEDSVRDQIIADTGLDADRSKTYDLGNQIVKIRLQKDLSFTVELPDGKMAKSLPKKNADPEKYAAANEDFSGLKKSIKKIIKSRINSLFDDFLSGRTRNAESWKGSYLENPLLRDIASILVWQQGNKSFTLTETEVIDSTGNPYSLTGEEVFLAYPAEMDAQDLAVWQDYFMDNHLKQPFLQLWEPVRNLSEVKPDRYKGDLIPFYRFLHQEKHGISISWDYHGYSYECPFAGCSGSIERMTGSRHIDTDDLFEVRNIKPYEGSRYANHIIAYLDRITILERIQKDDTTIIDLLPQFTAAQISEFISIATEANAVNVTAMLLEYKNTHYPDLDPLVEFTLDFL